MDVNKHIFAKLHCEFFAIFPGWSCITLAHFLKTSRKMTEKETM